jgi:hypothetical protein
MNYMLRSFEQHLKMFMNCYVKEIYGGTPFVLFKVLYQHLPRLTLSVLVSF